MPRIKMLNVTDVAKRTGLNPYTVRAMLRDGEDLIGYKIRGRWKVKESDLNSYMKSKSNKR